MTIEYLMKPRQVRMHYRDLLMYPFTFRFLFPIIESHIYRLLMITKKYSRITYRRNIYVILVQFMYKYLLKKRSPGNTYVLPRACFLSASFLTEVPTDEL